MKKSKKQEEPKPEPAPSPEVQRLSNTLEYTERALNAANKERLVLKAENDRLRLRLDACLYAMHLMQMEVRKAGEMTKAFRCDESSRMSWDEVSLAS